MSQARRRGRGLVGRDLARAQRAERRRIPPGAIIGLLVAGFALAALRIEITELDYALGRALTQKNELAEESRVLKARLEELRSPDRLARFAAERGFQRAEDVIELAPLVLAVGESVRP